MTKLQRLELKCGDRCTRNRGSDKDRVMVVVGAFEEFVVVRPEDNRDAGVSIYHYRWLRPVQDRSASHDIPSL